MNEWSQRRKRIILSLIFGFLIFFIGLPVFFFFYRGPTCTDGKQNGDEKGIDCGGGCKKLCQADNLSIILKGDPQVVQVGSTTYAVVIQAQNPNLSSDILRARYIFRMYESSSTVPVRIIDGDVYVPQGQKFAVFEGPFDFSEAKPDRATFEWKQDSLVWNTNTKPLTALVIEEKYLSGEGEEPRLTAELYNPSLDKVNNVELTAIISDEQGNTIGVSKTFVDSIEKEGREPIVFTWPQPFVGTPALIDILIKELPDKSFL